MRSYSFYTTINKYIHEHLKQSFLQDLVPKKGVMMLSRERYSLPVSDVDAIAHLVNCLTVNPMIYQSKLLTNFHGQIFIEVGKQKERNIYS